MPQWTGFKSSRDVCKNEWNRMHNALTRHEDTHRLYFLEGIARIANEIAKQPKGRLS
jgi:hypothetical protein